MPFTIAEARELFSGTRTTEEIGGSPYKIVVLDRGFVVYGRVEKSGNYIVIRECRCVRRWGTTKGLGELAINGPLKDTTLDGQPDTRVHELQVVQMIDAGGAPWTR